MRVKAGSLRGMPRAGLNACKLKLAGRVNGCSIPTSYNAVMRRQNRAICHLAAGRT